MAYRFREALAIQEGACNPSGIAYAIIEACKEARHEDRNPTEDVAVRLMVHQLAYICNIAVFDTNSEAYDAAIKECLERQAAEDVKKPPKNP